MRLHRRHFLATATGWACAQATRSALGADTTAPSPSPAVSKRDFHGWSESVVLSNGVVEAIVVPQIGRLMQFGFVGETDGPIWQNVALLGKAHDPEAKEWQNFGGDKVWPAQQKDWKEATGREWPPQPTFDGLPLEVREVKETPGTIELIYPVDPHWGLRATRRISLDPIQPFMRVATTFEKVSGPAVNVAVWVVTQLRDPLLLAAAASPTITRPLGFDPQSPERPSALRLEGGMLTLERRKDKSSKIGLDSRSLLWIGEKHVLKIDALGQTGPKAVFPDNNCRSEIYTNPDPLAYIELETLGPLTTLKTGQKTTWANVYKLSRRSHPNPRLEAARKLAYCLIKK